MTTAAVAARYDPLREFVAQDEPPAQVRPVDPAALGAYHRGLLTAKNTTALVEAQWREAVHEVCVAQRTAHGAHARTPWLDIGVTTLVVQRDVTARGATTGAVYYTARIRLVPDRLPEGFVDALQRPGVTVDSLLDTKRVETRRVLLWCGHTARSVLCRSYLIVCRPDGTRSRPAVEVTEFFTR